MTPQDNQLLQDFLDQLARAQAGTKDREAEVLITRAFAQQPDAPYLLVQRAVLLEQALKQAQAQIAQLQQQSSSIFGTRPGSTEPTRVPATASAPGYAPTQAMPRASEPGSPMGSFLGNAAATAAGVAGGAFLFQGLEHLFGHGGSFLGANAPAGMVENVTVNNYGGGNDSTDPPADDDASDTVDAVDDADSSDDSSWT